MKNTVKVKKRDALKPFSIVAGALLVILSLGVVFVSLTEFVVTLFAQIFVYGINIYNILSAASTLAPGIVSVLLMLIAALILFINKNSSAIYFPSGLLTYTVFWTWATLIINFIAARFLNALYIQLISPIISLIFSLILVAIPTLLFFVASCTFLKKVKFVPMFIVFALLAVGIVINLAANGLIIITDFYIIMQQLEYFRGVGTVLICYNYFISPLIEIAIEGGVCFAILLAAIGMCSKPKVVASKENVADESAVDETEPEMTTTQNEAAG